MKLSDFFFVLATQNPIESHGTYPLPEAQMDRFAMKFNLGYVTSEEEGAILTDQARRHPIEDVTPVATEGDVIKLKALAKEVRLSEELKRYIVELVGATRSAAGVRLGASPRASLALMNSSRALALVEGTDFVTPDHIQTIAVPTVAHRLIMEPQAKFSGVTPDGVVREILKKVPVPA
jgi:MoxR-like ATPase